MSHGDDNDKANEYQRERMGYEVSGERVGVHEAIL